MSDTLVKGVVSRDAMTDEELADLIAIRDAHAKLTKLIKSTGECIICKTGNPRNKKSCAQCTAVMCISCIDQLSAGAKCPCCSHPDIKNTCIKLSLVHVNVMDEVCHQTPCRHDGCEVLVYDDEEQEAHDKVCQYKPYTCDLCSKVVIRHDDHMSECEKRPCHGSRYGCRGVGPAHRHSCRIFNSVNWELRKLALSFLRIIKTIPERSNEQLIQELLTLVKEEIDETNRVAPVSIIRNLMIHKDNHHGFRNAVDEHFSTTLVRNSDARDVHALPYNNNIVRALPYNNIGRGQPLRRF